MKELIIDYPDHVSKTALIDFITKACHFYFDDYLENLELVDGDDAQIADISYLEELLDAVNNMGFHRYSSEMTNVWQLNSDLENDDL